MIIIPTWLASRSWSARIADYRHRTIPSAHELKVHDQTRGPAVSVLEWMNGNQLIMCLESVFRIERRIFKPTREVLHKVWHLRWLWKDDW